MTGIYEMTLTEMRHHVHVRQRVLLRQIADRMRKLDEVHRQVPTDERSWWARERRVAVLRAEEDVLRRELHEVAARYAAAWYGREGSE
jgi:hypothetical protein